MPKQWEADIQFSEQDVFILIGQQFPALAPIRIKMLGTGWDNVAFLVNERLVFRFPRRLIAASLLKREVRMLPLLAPHLPVQIPIPEYVGYPTDTYPYVFAGYPLLAGITACRCFCSHDERVALAVPIARFLSALHHIPVDSATLQWPPRDDIARADVGGRAATVKERLYDTSTVEALISLVDTLATTPLNVNELRWVHGDFYARHLVLDASNQFAGVIDWGDAHLGDPALDLSIAFSFLPPAARARFRAAYGDIDDATWRRARFRALHYGAMLVEYGIDVADAALKAAGEDALRFAPIDE